MATRFSDPKVFIRIAIKEVFGAFEEEYKFSDRKYKFDYCIPEHKWAIEYEGIQSSKSRHTSITGYSKDCEKYNLAQILGWRVLRYTTLNYMQLYDDLKKIKECQNV